jgi:hypothetical protein
MFILPWNWKTSGPQYRFLLARLATWHFSSILSDHQYWDTRFSCPSGNEVAHSTVEAPASMGMFPVVSIICKPFVEFVSLLQLRKCREKPLVIWWTAKTGYGWKKMGLCVELNWKCDITIQRGKVTLLKSGKTVNTGERTNTKFQDYYRGADSIIATPHYY